MTLDDLVIALEDTIDTGGIGMLYADQAAALLKRFTRACPDCNHLIDPKSGLFRCIDCDDKWRDMQDKRLDAMSGTQGETD